jgi:hypothetical protein
MIWQIAIIIILAIVAIDIALRIRRRLRAPKEGTSQIITQGLQAMESLNKILENGGHKLEVVKQPDGSHQVIYKQIWSDEEIAKNDQEFGERLFNSMGRKLLDAQSIEAKLLLLFLKNEYQTNTNMNLEISKDIGVAWFACQKVASKNPDSEFAQMFTELNDAWMKTILDKE